MKWGQWAATRADIFPPDMCSELAKLQTKAPAHSLAHTERTIRHALGGWLQCPAEKSPHTGCRHSSSIQAYTAHCLSRYVLVESAKRSMRRSAQRLAVARLRNEEQREQ